ncbi:MAG: ABC transporter substrate-binding protein, partial [Rhodopila sp.]|nr:ABC transporter substrate-binding protein [Rhodopila sp.]
MLTATQPDADLTASADTLRLGYVPLTDAAPLLIAQEKGFFRRQGLGVSLTPVASWASLRDRIAFGMLDGAQMLSPMPIAATLGLGGVRTELVVGATLGRNGNTITFGDALAGEIAAAAGPAPATAARVGRALAGVLAARR